MAFAFAFIRIHSELNLTAVAFNCQAKNYKERHYSLQKCNKEENKKKKSYRAHSTENYLLKIDEIKHSQGALKSLMLSNYKLHPLYASQIISFLTGKREGEMHKTQTRK